MSKGKRESIICKGEGRREVYLESLLHLFRKRDPVSLKEHCFGSLGIFILLLNLSFSQDYSPLHSIIVSVFYSVLYFPITLQDDSNTILFVIL